jgi:hypothetical protein
VCPPNFFLQSALVRTRRTERTKAAVLEAFEYNLIETTICAWQPPNPVAKKTENSLSFFPHIRRLDTRWTHCDRHGRAQAWRSPH